MKMLRLDSDSSNGDDLGPSLRAYSIFLTVMTLISIVLRFWSRSLLKNGRRFWWDDWAALVAATFTLGQSAFGVALASLGIGKHLRDLDHSNYLALGRSIYVMYLVYGLALTTAKVSALLFFSRVFPSFATNMKFRVALWVTHGLNAAWLMAFTLIKMLQCNQTPQFWDFQVNNGKCLQNQPPLQMGIAVASVVIDLMILVLPVPLIIGLQSSRARKAGIIITFMLGYGVVVVSIGRLVTVVKIEEKMKKDLTYWLTAFLWWGLLEAPITLFGACLPAMAALGRNIRRAFIHRSRRAKSESQSDHQEGRNKVEGSFASVRLESMESLNPTAQRASGISDEEQSITAHHVPISHRDE